MKSKMVIVVYPRKKKLTKEQIIREVAVNSILALLSTGGSINTGRLTFQLTELPMNPGIPIGWFAGDSQFNIEVIRIMKEQDFKTLYYWCKSESEKVPVSLGITDKEESVLVIGPYWGDKIDSLISRSISSISSVRPFTTETIAKKD